MAISLKHQIIKAIICTAVLLGVTLNVSAQNARKNNFFADIKSINVIVGLQGDFNFCNVKEGDIRSAVGYTLANSPLKRINKESIDYLDFSIIVLNLKSERGMGLGCSAAITTELRRPTYYRGSNNYITVWSGLLMRVGTENTIGRQINEAIEDSTKEFVVKWADQN
jgi:hypothetical protein